jgi:hypothetical protein
LLHRDLKPSNLVLGEDGEPRLVDFGLAAHLGNPALRELSGTPPYMAPEQARQQWERIDFRTDVYGLAAVLYALLTGQPPHPGETRIEALAHARRGEVTPPRERNRAISRTLQAIVLKALAPDPDCRFAGAREFRRALASHRRRPLLGLAALAGCLTLSATAWLAWPASSATPRPPGVSGAASTRLAGDLIVRVWSPPGSRGNKRGWRVEEPGALPVLPGDLVHLEAQLSRPAFAYLLWLDGQGQVASLYPWNDRAFASRRGSETAHEAVHFPPELDEGLPMRGPAGLETALLLVRESPLPEGTDLHSLVGQLPREPLGDPLEYAILGFDAGQPIGAINLGDHRSRGLGETPTRIDDPLLRLMERLRSHFVVIRAVRFAYRGT